jgi:hypothetical protein
LLARNDGARNGKDGLLLHHLGVAYGGNWRNRQAGRFPRLFFKTILPAILLMPH